MLAAHGLATVAKTVLKDRINRTRPADAIEHDRYCMADGKSKDGELRSMPSGHSAGVIAVTRAAARDYPGATVPLALGIGMIVARALGRSGEGDE